MNSLLDVLKLVFFISYEYLFFSDRSHTKMKRNYKEFIFV